MNCTYILGELIVQDELIVQQKIPNYFINWILSSVVAGWKDISCKACSNGQYMIIVKYMTL